MSQWPIPKQALARYYEQAFFLLSRVSIKRVRDAITELRRRYRDLGLPDGMLPGLFYPRWPMNVWESFGLQGRVNLVRGEVTDFMVNDTGAIAGLVVVAGRFKLDDSFCSRMGEPSPPAANTNTSPSIC